MAERRRLPVPEESTDPATSSPEAKRSRFDVSAEASTSGAEAEESGDRTMEERSLETTERLSLTEPSESSSSEETQGDTREEENIASGTTSSIFAQEEVRTDLERSTRHLTSRIMERTSDLGTSGGGVGESSLFGEHAHYEELSLIGDGAYGTVYKAKDLTSGQVVALKKVRVPLTEDGLPSSTLREIAGLKQLDRFEHPHIVRLLDVCQGNYLQLPSTGEPSTTLNRGLTLWLVFEHVERDLASYIASYSQTPIPAELVRRMSKEIVLGVDFLHSHRIIHRDLKPQNLLVTSEGRIKIADFGLAKTYDFEMRLTSVVVTLWYRAPEVLLGCPYATPVDLWSVGCILAELNTLRPLFPGSSEGDQLDRIFQLIGTPSQENWPENVSLSWTAFPQRRPKQLKSLIQTLDDNGLDLIKNLLTFDPHIRLTAAQALRHQYFANVES